MAEGLGGDGGGGGGNGGSSGPRGAVVPGAKALPLGPAFLAGGKRMQIQWVTPGAVFDAFTYPYYSRAIDLSAFRVLSADIHVLTITGTSLTVGFEHSVGPDLSDGGYWLASKTSGAISVVGHTSLQLNELTTATEVLGLMRMKLTFTSITVLAIQVNSYAH